MFHLLLIFLWFFCDSLFLFLNKHDNPLRYIYIIYIYIYIYIYIHYIYITYVRYFDIIFSVYWGLKNTFINLHIFYNHFGSFWLTRVCRDFLDLHKGSFTEQSNYFMPCCSINHNLSGCMKFRLYWQGPSFL